jgi:hypothetical protein
MARFRPQLYDRTVDEVVKTVMSEERLRLGDLNLVCTAFPYAFVVSCYGVFQCCQATFYRIQGFHKAVRGVKSVIGTLSAIYLDVSVRPSIQSEVTTYGKS